MLVNLVKAIFWCGDYASDDLWNLILMSRSDARLREEPLVSSNLLRRGNSTSIRIETLGYTEAAVAE